MSRKSALPLCLVSFSLMFAVASSGGALTFPAGVALLGLGSWLTLRRFTGLRLNRTQLAGLSAFFCLLGANPLSAQYTIHAVAGNGTAGYSGDNGAANAASLYRPAGVAVDASGNLYIADQLNNRVRKVDTLGNITTVAGGGSNNGRTGEAADAILNNPIHLAVDNAGNLYITEASGRVSVVGTSGTMKTVAEQIQGVSGVAVDGKGNLYLADTAKYQVRKLTSGLLTPLAGTGVAGYWGDNGAAATAQLNVPRGVALDAAGNLYIADASNSRIRKVDASGMISTVAGNGIGGFAGDGEAATDAHLANPEDVAVDAAGNLYIADTGNNRIRKVTPDGIITTIAGSGAKGSSLSGGQAVKAELDSPAGIAVDAAGNVYVSDGGNNRAVVLTAYVPDDFDHNGVPDLLWQNDTTSAVTIHYYGTSQTMIGWGWINQTGVPGWHVVAVADFNGDGWPDIVWQNDTTRAVTVHYYRNNVDIGWSYLNKTGELGWTVVGAADFNGDGHPDLVWSNDATGQAVVHYFVGSTYQSYAWLNQAGVPGWHVAAVADVNKDGQPDLIWENDTTAQITVHYYGGVNGATMQSWAWMNQTGAPGWHVKKALDFNGDGYPDLVWQNDATRQVTVNFYGGSKGATLLGWNWLQKTGVPGWQIVRPLLSLITSASFAPSTVTIAPATTVNMTLDITPAPAAAVTVNLSSNNTAAATVPATVTIPANATSVTVPVHGVAIGAATIQASGSNASISFGATTAAVTVAPSGGATIVMSNPTVGQNLQNNFLVELSSAAPAGGVNVTITAGDATKALVAGRSSDTGTSSITVNIAAGTQTVGAYVQGLASGGTVTMTANAPGYISTTSTITLGPSGFVLLGPGSASSFSTIQGATSNLTVYPNLLDSSFNPVTPQQLRAGYSVSLNVTDSNPTAGTISGSPLLFSNATPSLTVSYTGVTGGASSVLTAVAPTGFSAPAGSGNVVTAMVSKGGLVAPNVEVGRNLETTIDVPLNATAGPSGLLVTITSNNPSLVQFSTTATGAPESTIVLNVPSGQTVTPQFYVYGLASGGTATYTATAPGLLSGTGTVTLAPSGVIIGTAGNSTSFTTATNDQTPTNLTVTSVMIDPNSGILTQQGVASTLALSVNVTSSNTAVGTITSSPVSIFGGSSTATTQFQPGSSAGTATISINTPSGYNTPSVQQTVTAKVIGGIVGIQNQSIGQNLEVQGFVNIVSAQTSALAVTLTSANPSLVQFSTTATGAGSGTLVVTIPAGSQSVPVYIQAFGSSGTVQYTAAASGYATNSATVTLTPSGAVVVGPFGQFLSAPLSGGATPVTVYTTQLDPNNANADTGNYQQLAGGLSVTVNLTSTNTSTGTVPTSVTIQGGSNSATANFTPLAAGSTSINAGTPAGYTTPGTDGSLPVIVTNN